MWIYRSMTRTYQGLVHRSYVSDNTWKIVTDFNAFRSIAHHSQCHVLGGMPQLYCHDCPATVVPSQLSCPSCTVLLSCSGHTLLSFLSCLYHPDILRLSCPGCPAQAFLSQLSCPSILSPALFPTVLYLLLCFHCPVQSILSFMPCPRSPVLEILHWLSCPDCPVLTVLSWLSRAIHTWLIKRIDNKWKKKIPFPETWAKCTLQLNEKNPIFFFILSPKFSLFLYIVVKKSLQKVKKFFAKIRKRKFSFQLYSRSLFQLWIRIAEADWKQSRADSDWKHWYLEYYSRRKKNMTGLQRQQFVGNKNYSDIARNLCISLFMIFTCYPLIFLCFRQLHRQRFLFPF